MFQGLFVISCLITIVSLILLPGVFGLAKVEKDIPSGNVTSVYKKGLALYKVGNYTQADAAVLTEGTSLLPDNFAVNLPTFFVPK